MNDENTGLDSETDNDHVTDQNDDSAGEEDLTTGDQNCWEVEDDRDYLSELSTLYERIRNLRHWSVESKRELSELTTGRCTANLLFIEALKEHKLGIQIVEELIQMSANFDVSTGMFIQKENL